MKPTIFFLAFSCLTYMAKGQTVEEWLQQKQTALKYLAEQLVALKSYGQLLGEGYSVVQKGLSLVQRVKGADYQQHDAHFQSLGLVNSYIRQYLDNRSPHLLYEGVVKKGADITHKAGSSAVLHKDEKAFIQHVVELKIEGSLTLLTALQKAMTSDAFEMKDKARLEHIKKLFDELREKKVQLYVFGRSVEVLVAHREKAILEMQSVKNIVSPN